MNLLDFCNNCDRLKSFVNKDISRKNSVGRGAKKRERIFSYESKKR